MPDVTLVCSASVLRPPPATAPVEGELDKARASVGGYAPVSTHTERHRAGPVLRGRPFALLSQLRTTGGPSRP